MHVAFVKKTKAPSLHISPNKLATSLAEPELPSFSAGCRNSVLFTAISFLQHLDEDTPLTLAHFVQLFFLKQRGTIPKSSISPPNPALHPLEPLEPSDCGVSPACASSIGSEITPTAGFMSYFELSVTAIFMT